MQILGSHDILGLSERENNQQQMPSVSPLKKRKGGGKRKGVGGGFTEAHRVPTTGHAYVKYREEQKNPAHPKPPFILMMEQEPMRERRLQSSMAVKNEMSI